MVKPMKMEQLRALVRECLSTVADEILKIVERTIIEHEEEEVSCSKWVVDNHHRLLDVAKSHCEDVKLQSDEQKPAANANANMENTHACDSDQSDQDILGNIEEDDDDVKPRCDQNTPLTVRKPFKCPFCFSGFSSKKTLVRHIKKHPDHKSSPYQCQFCDRRFCQKSEFILHTRINKCTKPCKFQDYEKSFDLQGQKYTEKKPNGWFSDNVASENHHRSVRPASHIGEELDSRQNESGNGIMTFPLNITPYDRSEFNQASLQPVCLYQIQTVADKDKDSAATVPVGHIKSEPDGSDGGASDSGTNDRPLLPVNPSDTEPKHHNVQNTSPRTSVGKPTKLIVQFEAGTREKPYKCPCCTRCFSLTKTLIRHVKLHTEDKPYQCQFCRRNFCQKSDLVNHTRIHTGERPYQCQECHKSFAQKGNLVVHMRKHRGEKPYQCQ